MQKATLILASGLLTIGFSLNAVAQNRNFQGIPNPTPAQDREILRLGSRGSEVTQIQAVLKLLGYYTGEVDGIYDENTLFAVSRFQQAAGLEADGIFGVATWNRLLPVTPSVVVVSPETPPTIPVVTSTPSREASTSETPPSVTPSSTSISLPILREGMRGEAVVLLQERLKRLGFLQGQADGVFGENTLAAVKAAQRRYNLEADGIVGSATWRALLSQTQE